MTLHIFFLILLCKCREALMSQQWAELHFFLTDIGGGVINLCIILRGSNITQSGSPSLATFTWKFIERGKNQLLYHEITVFAWMDWNKLWNAQLWLVTYRPRLEVRTCFIARSAKLYIVNFQNTTFHYITNHSKLTTSTEQNHPWQGNCQSSNEIPTCPVASPTPSLSPWLGWQRPESWNRPRGTGNWVGSKI
jgi:hypothetical protein